MYQLLFSKEVADFIKKLDNSTKTPILKKLEKLKNQPDLGKPMTGQLTGLRSLRIGDYRAIYSIEHEKLSILVIKVGHRKNVY
ncbi:type II toxin-antitoxin system RelE/ParE family toxin [Candidatus Pacearchaeota archaeon]|nr:type II toxin-antitoxin system RelE/ParE family toxin [Candidatus Pacearchaeota archaeon]